MREPARCILRNVVNLDSPSGPVTDCLRHFIALCIRRRITERSVP
jgi:hypothetical protein